MKGMSMGGNKGAGFGKRKKKSRFSKAFGFNEGQSVSLASMSGRKGSSAIKIKQAMFDMGDQIKSMGNMVGQM